MKTKVLTFIFTLCVHFSVGQIVHSISIGPDLGIPTESFGKANLGFGGSLEYNVKFSGPVGAQFHIGYQSFSNKIYSDQKVTFLPIRLGVIGFIYQDILFLNADAGISHYYSPSTGTNQNGFTFGAGGGSKLKLGSGQFIQVSAYYNLHHYDGLYAGNGYNYNWFNIRAAYGLSWGKKNDNKSE
ncbi:MAG TPA: hypothetical protein VF487_21080 [Chitinophagaceae bacterium]